MKKMLIVGMIMAVAPSAYGLNIGSDTLYGAGSGVASLGVYYGSQNYFQETEGRALGLAALAGVVLLAWAAASSNGNTTDFLATMVAAFLTFGAGKYLVEQAQNPQPVVQAEVGAQVQPDTTSTGC